MKTLRHQRRQRLYCKNSQPRLRLLLYRDHSTPVGRIKILYQDPEFLKRSFIVSFDETVYSVSFPDFYIANGKTIIYLSGISLCPYFTHSCTKKILETYKAQFFYTLDQWVKLFPWKDTSTVPTGLPKPTRNNLNFSLDTVTIEQGQTFGFYSLKKKDK